MENNDTGLLLNKKDIELHRNYFRQMTKLIGINVVYRSPKASSKDWDANGELDTFYNAPVVVGCIFQEHANVWTMKKLGWNSELQEGDSIIHVPYDLPGLQVGALFVVPSALDGTKGRVFRVTRMSTIQVYPASIACEIAPEWESNAEKSQSVDFNHTDFNVLAEEENFR